MHLAPVRAAADGGRDRFERAEILLVRQPRVLVDRHVGGLPAVGGRQPDVVVGRDADLDGEHHRVGEPRHRGAQFAEHVEERLPGHRVLRLDEPDPAGGHEHLVRRGGIRSLGERARGEPVERLDERGHRAPGAAQRAERGVLHHLVLEEMPPRWHSGQFCPPVVALHQRVLAVGEPVELEVVV
jgi:hypothetical protein